MSQHRFEGQVVLVTGGARGIGLAIGRQLFEEGATVVLGDIDVNVAERVKENLTEGRSGSGRIHARKLDVADPESCKFLATWLSEQFGHLDILVNNAAILDISPLEELTIEHFRHVCAVNLDGALNCTLAVLPLQKRGSRILFTASIMGQFGSIESIPYSSAKGGIVNMVRALACDLGPKGITVNGISPGFIDTRMARLPDGTHEHATEYFRTVYLKHGKIPLGRTGTPDDIAGPAAFLVSEDAAYITGQILAIDGGVTSTF